MRGCFWGLLLWLAGVAATVAAFLALFRFHFGVPPSSAIGASLLAGGLTAISLGLARGWLQARSDHQALRAGLAGAAPVDGKKAVLVGPLRPLGSQTLVAPLDGTPCVAYSYTITEHSGTGKQAFRYTHYKGVALVPSVIETATGNYRLLAVPDFEGEAPPLSRSLAEEKAAAYLAATRFLPKAAAARELEDRWSDQDGAYRSDVSYVGDSQVDLERCSFEQYRVKPGDPVCLIGPYAAASGGLVGSRDWSVKTRLLLGNLDQVGATLQSQIKTRLILAVLTAAAAAGVVWAFTQNQA